MARRRVAELPAGAVLFDRSAEEWRRLRAPGFVSDVDVAAEAYAHWAGACFDPHDEVNRRYFVEMGWLKRCVRPQFLAHVGALNPAEIELMSDRGSARWGRIGRCWAPRLEADAVGVPRWLWCCRRDPRTVTR
jgi:hypothetical protein